MVIKTKSVAIRANRNSGSLRTTIPNLIKEIMELREGDTIMWEYKCAKGATFKVTVSSRNEGGGV